MDSISTAITQRLGIRYPIISGGMVWASGWRLATAVSQAGGLGLIGSGSMTPDVLAHHLTKAMNATTAPIGVNVPLMHQHASDNLEVALAHGVRIFFTSAGSPRLATQRLKASGAFVAHVVPSAKLALKVEEAGCDAVVAEGTEAGGHNGFEELCSAVLWPSVVDTVHIPVIAAGGIADGRGLAAALAFGAQAVQVGSRFAVTVESSAHENYKGAAVSSREAAAKLYLRRLMPTRALLNDYLRRAMDAEALGAGAAQLSELLGRGRARQGVFDGDTIEGELEIGQVAGRIDDIPTVAEVMDRMVRQYTEAVANLPRAKNRVHESPS